MAILSIDTCLQSCGAALVANGTVRAARAEPLARGHAERLAPLVHEVLAEAGMGLDDVTRVAVTIGPGSFTGVRVGLAFARGLAVGTEREVIGLTTLEVIAAATHAHEGAVKAVLIDARRGQVYGQVFEGDSAGEPFISTPEHAREMIEKARGSRDLVLAGSGVPLAYPERADQFNWTGQQPDPVVMCQLVAERSAPALPPSALYLRAADVKPGKPGLRKV